MKAFSLFRQINQGIGGVAFCLLLSFSQLASAQSRVIDETAIPYSGFLKKAQFDQRFPGEVISDLSKLASGWYVIYEHEALSYYFGPILLESTGEDYLEELTNIVEQAAAQRPDIQGYRLELSFEPSALGPSKQSKTEENKEISSPPPPPPSKGFSIFGFFRKLFGL